jgi:hypothetical protein
MIVMRLQPHGVSDSGEYLVQKNFVSHIGKTKKALAAPLRNSIASFVGGHRRMPGFDWKMRGGLFATDHWGSPG